MKELKGVKKMQHEMRKNTPNFHVSCHYFFKKLFTIYTSDIN